MSLNGGNYVKKEMESMHSNEASPTEKRKGSFNVYSRWTIIERYKAQLNASHGDMDYDETLCPVVRGESVRLVHALK